LAILSAHRPALGDTASKTLSDSIDAWSQRFPKISSRSGVSVQELKQILDEIHAAFYAAQGIIEDIRMAGVEIANLVRNLFVPPASSEIFAPLPKLAEDNCVAALQDLHSPRTNYTAPADRRAEQESAWLKVFASLLPPTANLAEVQRMLREGQWYGAAQAVRK